MTEEQLGALAISAIDDVEARPVLVDAIEESGWWDERCWFAVGWPWAAGRWPGPAHFMATAALHTPFGPRAITAVLLFGNWPTDPAEWPLVERCHSTLLCPERCWSTPNGARCDVCGMLRRTSLRQSDPHAKGDGT